LQRENETTPPVTEWCGEMNRQVNVGRRLLRGIYDPESQNGGCTFRRWGLECPTGCSKPTIGGGGKLMMEGRTPVGWGPHSSNQGIAVEKEKGKH